MAILDWFQSSQGTSPASLRGHSAGQRHSGSPEPSMPPLKRGASITADFAHGHDIVHTLCRVEKLLDEGLRLQIISELGKVPMIGLKVGTTGQFDANNWIFPFRVTRVSLPVIDITVIVTQARPVKRQFLRVPVSAPVRLRPSGSQGAWITGKSLDFSAGGCGVAYASSLLPTLGARYDMEVTLSFSSQETEQLSMTGEVRWAKRAAGEVHVGLEVKSPAQRRILAAVVSRLQHAMSRRPDDYLLL